MRKNIVSVITLIAALSVNTLGIHAQEAVTSAPVENVAPAINRSAVALATKCAINDAVMSGTYLNLPDGAISNGRCYWIQPSIAAWDHIYGAFCGWSYETNGFVNGQFLSEIINRNIKPEGVMIYLDNGYFVEYCDQFKAMGLIPASYQLPKSYYCIVKSGGSYKRGVYKAYNILTDCPNGQARENYWSNMYIGTALPAPYESYMGGYTPKYLLE